MNNILFFDLEIDEKTEKIRDIGAILNNETFHSSSIKIFEYFAKDATFICGHNIINQAHCFSSWGQDFRVDYLYIGNFLKLLMEEKKLAEPIPVSCFTATAKISVIEDITNYFKEKLNEQEKITAKRIFQHLVSHIIPLHLISLGDSEV